MTNGQLSDPRKGDHWRQLVQRWQHSGQSIRDFCRQHRLSEPSFYYWRRRLAPQQPPLETTPPAVTFLPLEVHPQTTQPPAVLELVLSHGCLMRVPAGFDPSTLRTVLALLKEDVC
jgi:transposase-like protein